jgi:transposase
MAALMSKTELEEAPMTIVVGLDVHREQITFDALDTHTGEVRRGRVRPADREHFRCFLRRFDGEPVEAALEATTGWRFIVEELQAAGAKAHLAEPAETRSLRGRKRRAKTDRLDARHLRNLLLEGRLPESWIPPEHIRELRTKVRLRKTLVDQRSPGSTGSRPSSSTTECRRHRGCWCPRAAIGSPGSSCRTPRAP